MGEIEIEEITPYYTNPEVPVPTLTVQTAFTRTESQSGETVYQSITVNLPEVNDSTEIPPFHLFLRCAPDIVKVLDRNVQMPIHVIYRVGSNATWKEEPPVYDEKVLDALVKIYQHPRVQSVIVITDQIEGPIDLAQLVLGRFSSHSTESSYHFPPHFETLVRSKLVTTPSPDNLLNIIQSRTPITEDASLIAEF